MGILNRTPDSFYDRGATWDFEAFLGRADQLVAEVTEFLLDRARRAESVGLRPEQIVVDAGLDLGKTPAQSAVLLRESAQHASLGFPLLLSASNKRFIGELLERDIDDRRAESLAAVAYGVMQGCRVVRVHDVAGTARVCRTIEALLCASFLSWAPTRAFSIANSS